METKQQTTGGEWITRERRWTDKNPRIEFSFRWYENTMYEHL